MISLKNVSKSFGKRLVVDQLTLQVPRGEIFGLLGHNGAGKSTTIGMLLGMVYPDKGEIRVADHDVFTERAQALIKVGAIFESPAFYDYLSGASNLRTFAEYSGPVDKSRMAEAIELVGLKERILDPVRTYSHGMRQRLALAQALLPRPEILILDEPNDGLDPEGILAMRQMIQRLNQEWNLTILLSSHVLNEVEQLCTRLAVMREGRLLFAGDWRQLGMNRSSLRMRVDRQAEAEKALLAVNLVTEWGADGRGLLPEGVEISRVAEWLVREGYRIELIAPTVHTLEDFYMQTIHVSQTA